jgi:DNA topoisomerase-1
LVEIDGRKFESKNIKSILKTAERAGFKLEEKTETENSKGRGPARNVIRLKGSLVGGPSWQVKSLETKRVKSRPNPPFITSTLQQTAANQLDFTTQKTMSTAQALYEGVSIGDMGSVGLITYMRTDSTHITNEAIDMARDYISAQIGEKYLPEKPNWYPTSDKKAQEAHEAIRPTDVSLTPDQVRSSLNDQQFKLYRLIWERFVACQMTDALWDSTTVLIAGTDKSGELVFRTSGRVLFFDGYYRVVGQPNTSKEAVLPPLKKEQSLANFHIDPVQSFTSPPPRYTEASLVKKLEAEGIGRPSTYAQIIQVIQNRKYVEKNQKRFYATDLGKVVTDKLIEAFPEILEVGYTRDMEQQLDDVEEKHANWVQMLKAFYGPFKASLETAYDSMEHAKAETEPAPHTCPECGSGTVYRFGRNGRFLSCSQYPDCKYAAPIDREGNPAVQKETDVACPKCNTPLLLRTGRFGPFLSCSKYPDCDGIVNLDKKGFISPPKVPPLQTDLPCPKCKSPLNLRRGERGPWLSCSKFPKCRGRLGWAPLAEDIKEKWEKTLKKHEKAHPLPPIKKLDGSAVGQGYKPQVRSLDDADDEEA